MTDAERERREPRKDSDRIGKRECTWKYHPEFFADLKRLGVDQQTWKAIKQMMKSAADGTARGVHWEYPCQSSTGIVGELKLQEATDVTYLDDDNNVIEEETTAFYRLYFNEPTLCPSELWLLGVGVKSHHAHFESTDQQTDIELATLRASTTHGTGRDLHDFPL